MRPTQLGSGFYYVTVRADDLEMVIQIGKGFLQAGAESKPGFPVDRFRDRATELKIIREHGFCILKVTLLDGIHEGLYSFSFIHNAFLYNDTNVFYANGPGN